jgi:hypothetical protein
MLKSRTIFGSSPIKLVNEAFLVYEHKGAIIFKITLELFNFFIFSMLSMLQKWNGKNK